MWQNVEKKTVPAYNALPVFLDRVWFVNENMILFQISKQYYINEIKLYDDKRIPLKSVVSIGLFYGWVKKKRNTTPTV